MEKSKIAFAAFIINTMCTLKCKNCITRTPYKKNPENYKTENIIRDIDGAFEIFQHMDHLDFEGGEPLLHPGIAELVKYAMTHVSKGNCDEVRILTNCTIIPSGELLKICANKNFLFLLDDYGDKLSVKKKEIIDLMEKYGIRYRVDVYSGENQYFDGWIDFGDFTFKNSTPEELLTRVTNCRSAQKMPDIKDGKIFLCGVQLSGMNHIELCDGEYVDMRDSTKTLEEKVAIANLFGTRPINHCNYCNGFIIDSKRIPAAEQLEMINNDMRNCE